MRKRTGVTFMELMIVVVIMGILALIARTRFYDARMASQIATAKAQMKALSRGLKDLYIDIGQWPKASDNSTANGIGVYSDSMTDWQRVLEQGLEIRTSSPIPNWQGPYLKVPSSEPWGSYYVFRAWTNTPGRYTYVLAQGPKGTPNGTGLNPRYAVTGISEGQATVKQDWPPDSEGFSMIPYQGNKAYFPLDGDNFTDFNILLWLE